MKAPTRFVSKPARSAVLIAPATTGSDHDQERADDHVTADFAGAAVVTVRMRPGAPLGLPAARQACNVPRAGLDCLARTPAGTHICPNKIIR